MNNFKFFRGEESISYLLTFHQPRYENAVEFCFQFDDNDPIVIGQGRDELRIIINPTPDGNITFTDDDRKFKIFTREINGGNRA